MSSEQPKRPRRNPLSHEEVANIIAMKERRAHAKLLRFKRSGEYRLLNICNITCFCIFLEIIFCFYGPCVYNEHIIRDVIPRYAYEMSDEGKQVVNDLEILTTEGKRYFFIVNAAIDIPFIQSAFFVGKDYLLRKELKGMFVADSPTFRLLKASPVLVLTVLALVISVGAFTLNLNENPYSLMALSVLNGCTLLGVVLI
jgi:hypothetical protein